MKHAHREIAILATVPVVAAVVAEAEENAMVVAAADAAVTVVATVVDALSVAAIASNQLLSDFQTLEPTLGRLKFYCFLLSRFPWISVRMLFTLTFVWGCFNLSGLNSPPLGAII